MMRIDAHVHVFAQASAEFPRKSFDTDRLLWATDFPWIAPDPGYGRLTRIVDELLPDLSAVKRTNIMGDNAKRFL
jgi:predicted TIM-barrel fold metal-dependent hydrolase